MPGMKKWATVATLVATAGAAQGALVERDKGLRFDSDAPWAAPQSWAVESADITWAPASAEPAAADPANAASWADQVAFDTPEDRRLPAMLDSTTFRNLQSFNDWADVEYPLDAQLPWRIDERSAAVPPHSAFALRDDLDLPPHSAVAWIKPVSLALMLLGLAGVAAAARRLWKADRARRNHGPHVRILTPPRRHRHRRRRTRSRTELRDLPR